MLNLKALLTKYTTMINNYYSNTLNFPTVSGCVDHLFRSKIEHLSVNYDKSLITNWEIGKTSSSGNYCWNWLKVTYASGLTMIYGSGIMLNTMTAASTNYTAYQGGYCSRLTYNFGVPSAIFSDLYNLIGKVTTATGSTTSHAYAGPYVMTISCYLSTCFSSTCMLTSATNLVLQTFSAKTPSSGSEVGLGFIAVYWQPTTFGA